MLTDGFGHHFVKTCQRCKRGKLCRPLGKRHTLMVLWLRPRQVHDIGVIFTYSLGNHALCPPISLFLAMVRASSLRFAAFSTAFLPNLCRRASIACCRDFSFCALRCFASS